MKLLRYLLSALLLVGNAHAQTPNPTFSTVNVTSRITHTAEVATPIVASMTNGATVAYPATHSIMTLTVNGTIATGTLTLPTTASIASGFIARIVSTGTVSSLTVTPNSGQSIAVAPTSISPGVPINLYWDASTATWRPLSAGAGLYNPASVAITGGTISGATISGSSITGTPISGSTGSFTNLSAANLTVSSTASGPGFATLFSSPADIGSVAPGQAWFTNLNVSGTVSGAGFDNIADFASPPVLGNVSPNTVNATNLTASGTVGGAGFTTLLASPGPIGSTSASTGAFTTLAASGATTLAGTVSGAGITGLFASPPAVGSTVPSTGAFTTFLASGVSTLAGTNRVGASDWLTALINWPMARTSQSVLSSNGRIGSVTASRTSDLDPVAAGTTQITIGNAAFAFADNTGTYPDDYFGAYGYYAEARVYPGTVSTAFGAEFNAINLTGGTVGTPTPYHDLFLSGTHALRLASGGGQSLSPNDALAAISITDNEAKFQTGIVFTNNAISGTDGVTGYGEAIQMARGHMLGWYRQDGSEGARTSFITSTMDDAAVLPVSLQFQNAGTLFLQNSSNIGFAVAHVANSVNGVEAVPSSTGNRVAVRAIGADTNVHLALTPRGTGTIVTDAALTPAAFAGSALTMRDNQTLTWINGGGNQLAAITNSVTDPAKITSLTLHDTGAYFYGAGGGILSSFAGVASGVNYPLFSNAATGNPVLITATGSDTNVPITISGKGSGIITLNAPSTTNVGDFNTGGLSASGTVSGAGFTARFASPGPIGDTSASTGAFTTLSATGTTSLGTASANYWTVTGAAATVDPTIAEIRLTANGTNDHVGALFAAKGDGWFRARRLVAQATSLTPTNNALPPIQQSIANDITGTISSGVASVASWYVQTDSAAAAGSVGGNLYYMNGLNNFGNTGMTGGRIGLNVSHALNRGNTSNAPGSNYFHTGIQSQVSASYRDGGVANNHSGQLFGMFTSSELREGAKHFNEVKGMEINVSIDQYASASRKFGLTISPATTDAEQAITEEAYINIGGKKANASSSIGMRVGMLYGGSAGYWGIPASGTLIDATPSTVEPFPPDYLPAPAMTAAYGIDWSLVTFGGGGLRFASASIDGSGNIGSIATTAGLSLQTLSGITAKSAGVSSYTVLDGGIFTAFPTITVEASPGGGTRATGTVATMGLSVIREIVTAGSGYSVDQILTISGSGTGTQATIRVTEVNGTGAITAAVMETAGSYSVLPSSPFAVATGSATFRGGYSILTVAPGTVGTLYPQFPAALVSVNTSALVRRAKIMSVMTASNTPLILANGYANYLTVTGAASTSPTTVSATGVDSDIYLRLLGKGTSPTEALRMSVGTSSGAPALFDGSRALNVRNNPLYTGEIVPSVLIQTNAAGSTTNTGQVAHHLFNNIDSLDASAADSVAGLAVYHTVNTGAVKPRIALQSSLNIAQNTSDPPGSKYYHQAFYAEAGARASAGGVSGNVGGNLFGGNIVGRLYTGALYYNSVVGLEINVGAQTGTSTDYKTGLQIVLQGADAVDSTAGISRAIVIGTNVDSPASPGFGHGIVFGGIGGYWPINPTTGILLYADPSTFGGGGPPVTAAWGIDFSGVVFSSGFLKSDGFTVSGTGVTTVSRLITASETPASASAACVVGTVTFDTNYVYTCVATNTWKRAATSTW